MLTQDETKRLIIHFEKTENPTAKELAAYASGLVTGLANCDGERPDWIIRLTERPDILFEDLGIRSN